MSPSSRSGTAPDPGQRRFQLYFLAAALDFVIPHVDEIVRLAQAAGLRTDVALAGKQLRGLRDDVNDAIMAPEHTSGTRPEREVSGTKDV